MELQIFSNSEFGEIRTITKDNEPMFCLADVCKALEISNVGNVKQRLSERVSILRTPLQRVECRK